MPASRPPRNQILIGDCIERLAQLPDASVDAVVCDPPYQLTFGGEDWDRFASNAEFGAWCERWGRQALRVLRPGGGLLACGSPRTYHRLVCGLEDAGFEIRDTLCWAFADRAANAMALDKMMSKSGVLELDAAAWAGWANKLKPAWEPIVLARKPLQGTLVANVLAHHTGALHVGAVRVPAADKAKFPVGDYGPRGLYGAPGMRTADPDPSTRYPSNLIATDPVFDDPDEPAVFGAGPGRTRFFLVPRATAAERGDYNTHKTVKPLALMERLVRMITPTIAADGQPGLVLDPFSGSGSTLIAAAAAGFDWLGVELDAAYAEIARRRLAERDLLDQAA